MGENVYTLYTSGNVLISKSHKTPIKLNYINILFNPEEQDSVR